MRISTCGFITSKLHFSIIPFPGKRLLTEILPIYVEGMSVGLASLYLTELPQKEIRGAIGSFHQLAATFGILVSQIIGMKEILGTS